MCFCTKLTNGIKAVVLGKIWGVDNWPFSKKLAHICTINREMVIWTVTWYMKWRRSFIVICKCSWNCSTECFELIDYSVLLLEYYDHSFQRTFRHPPTTVLEKNKEYLSIPQSHFTLLKWFHNWHIVTFEEGYWGQQSQCIHLLNRRSKGTKIKGSMHHIPTKCHEWSFKSYLYWWSLNCQCSATSRWSHLLAALQSIYHQVTVSTKDIIWPLGLITQLTRTWVIVR